MTTRANYTDQEWTLLVDAPMIVGLGMGMLVTSQSGMVGKAREILAYRSCLRRETALAIERRNHLVSAILDEQPSRRRALTAPLFSYGDPIPLLGAMFTARLHMVEYCEKVADVLADRTPYTEAQEFKRWLIWIARRIAQAGGGGWLGRTATITDAEERMLDRLAVSLRIVTIVDALASEQPMRLDL